MQYSLRCVNADMRQFIKTVPSRGSKRGEGMLLIMKLSQFMFCTATHICHGLDRLWLNNKIDCKQEACLSLLSLLSFINRTLAELHNILKALNNSQLH